MKTLSRRNVVQSSAVIPALVVGGVAGQVVSCQNGQVVVDPAVLTQIQQAVATACNFIPAVTTIVALVAASFPTAAGVGTIAASVLAQISHVLCAAAPNAASASAPLTANGVAVHGWVIQGGKLVYV